MCLSTDCNMNIKHSGGLGEIAPHHLMGWPVHLATVFS